ncbi:unnamed protein product, partial [marine sediment metagenome]
AYRPFKLDKLPASTAGTTGAMIAREYDKEKAKEKK